MKTKDTHPIDTCGILDRAERRSGMTVPDNYFEEFAAKMTSRLPRMEWEEDEVSAARTAPRSVWQKIRPYVYLAAMFAGVWCMMQMFGLGSGGGDMSVESRPLLAQALADPDFSTELLSEPDFSTNEDEIMETLWEQGVDPADLASPDSQE